MKTKKWYLQRNSEDNVFAAAQNLIYYLKIKTSSRNAYRKIKGHPNYPSSVALSDFFKSLNIEEMTIKIGLDQLKEVPLPALALLEGSEKELVMIHKIKGDRIEYIHPAIGWENESLDEFNSKWKGTCFIILKPKKTIKVEYDSINETAVKNLKYKSNKVKVYSNFLTEKECDQLINLAKPKLEPSKIRLPYGLSPSDPNYEIFLTRTKNFRTSHSALFEEEDNHPVIQSVMSKTAQLLKVPMEYIEYIQCASYKNGQEYKQHIDCLSLTQEELVRKGNRACTIIVYLNDSFVGGGTHFPNLDIVIQPKKGTAARFFLLDPFGNPDTELLHAGLPVLEGEKFILNIWIRDKEFFPGNRKTGQLRKALK